MYRVELKKSAIKDLKALPKNAVSRIAAKIDSLATEPYPSGSIKLKGVSEPLWRI
jgi:mRNA interferase RelE/StbE